MTYFSSAEHQMIRTLQADQIAPILLAHGWLAIDPSHLPKVYQENGGAHSFEKNGEQLLILSERWGNREAFLQQAVLSFAKVEDLSTFEALLRLSSQST